MATARRVKLILCSMAKIKIAEELTGQLTREYLYSMLPPPKTVFLVTIQVVRFTVQRRL